MGPAQESSYRNHSLKLIIFYFQYSIKLMQIYNFWKDIIVLQFLIQFQLDQNINYSPYRMLTNPFEDNTYQNMHLQHSFTGIKYPLDANEKKSSTLQQAINETFLKFGKDKVFTELSSQVKLIPHQKMNRKSRCFMKEIKKLGKQKKLNNQIKIMRNADSKSKFLNVGYLKQKNILQKQINYEKKSKKIIASSNRLISSRNLSKKKDQSNLEQILNMIINQSNQKDMKNQNQNQKQIKAKSKYKSYKTINKEDCPYKSSQFKQKVKLNLTDFNQKTQINIMHKKNSSNRVSIDLQEFLFLNQNPTIKSAKKCQFNTQAIIQNTSKQISKTCTQIFKVNRKSVKQKLTFSKASLLQSSKYISSKNENSLSRFKNDQANKKQILQLRRHLNRVLSAVQLTQKDHNQQIKLDFQSPNPTACQTPLKKNIFIDKLKEDIKKKLQTYKKLNLQKEKQQKQQKKQNKQRNLSNQEKYTQNTEGFSMQISLYKAKQAQNFKDMSHPQPSLQISRAGLQILKKKQKTNNLAKYSKKQSNGDFAFLNNYIKLSHAESRVLSMQNIVEQKSEKLLKKQRKQFGHTRAQTARVSPTFTRTSTCCVSPRTQQIELPKRSLQSSRIQDRKQVKKQLQTQKLKEKFFNLMVNCDTQMLSNDKVKRGVDIFENYCETIDQGLKTIRNTIDSCIRNIQ